MTSINITTLIAIYGACLSTVSLVYSYKQKHPKVKVRLNPGFKSDSPDAGMHAVISIINAGYTGIQINSAGIAYRSMKPTLRQSIKFAIKHRVNPQCLGFVHIMTPEIRMDGLPKVIDSFNNHTIWIPEHVFSKHWNNTNGTNYVAYAQDALGRSYYSNSLTFHIGKRVEDMQQ